MKRDFNFTPEEIEVARSFEPKISIKIEKTAITLRPKEPYCTVTFSVIYLGDCRCYQSEISSEHLQKPDTAVYDVPLKDVLSRFVDYLTAEQPTTIFTYPAAI